MERQKLHLIFHSRSSLILHFKPFTSVPPVWHILVHICSENMVMASLKQVYEFMYYYIFQTFPIHFRQLEVDPYPFVSDITGSPTCFHVFYTPFSCPHSYDVLPFSANLKDFGFEFTTIPFVYDLFSLSTLLYL